MKVSLIWPSKSSGDEQPSGSASVAASSVRSNRPCEFTGYSRMVGGFEDMFGLNPGWLHCDQAKSTVQFGLVFVCIPLAAK